ncbi:MAG TPA: sugar-transfer associated ATP-grasp domain-containing protein [Microbacteriaceae bacterium]|nr:sugar-transfer associated ATP-grasp domain-containing protein [Microbacteriaceae bacterium]
MKRVKYYLARLRSLDTANMRRVAGEISQRTGRSRLSILVDMVRCSIKYGAGYLDYEEYEFYLLTPDERATFMTSTHFDRIAARYNEPDYRHLLADKAEFNALFDRYLGREWLDARTATPEEIGAFLERHPVVMVKQPDSVHGHGVSRRDAADVTDPAAFRDALIASGHILIEEFIEQHPELAALAPRSVNTLRVITFFDGDRLHVLAAALKLGNDADVDNFGSGGMYTILDEEGVARYPAFDILARTYAEHPLTGKPIVGFRVPRYDEILRTLDEAARLVPQVPFVGWDVAVLPDGVSIVEGNWNTGGFQMKPSLTGVKTGLMPRFREVIDF